MDPTNLVQISRRETTPNPVEKGVTPEPTYYVVNSGAVPISVRGVGSSSPTAWSESQAGQTLHISIDATGVVTWPLV